MTDILIRDIDETLDKALKVRAIEHGRTREAEIKVILKSVVSRRPKKRSLADALMDIPKLDADVNYLFKRPDSSARNMDE
jgi:plasmid stability protein